MRRPRRGLYVVVAILGFIGFAFYALVVKTVFRVVPDGVIIPLGLLVLALMVWFDFKEGASYTDKIRRGYQALRSIWRRE